MRYGDGACPAPIAGGTIGERAASTKGELERCACIDRAAVKRTRCIGRGRMRGGVIVCPGNGVAYLDRQRVRLEAGVGNGNRVGWQEL